MYRKIDEFIDDWKSESESTRKVFGALTNESLDQKVYDQGRSIRQLAWHITVSLSDTLHHSGLPAEAIDESQPAPKTVDELIKRYESESKKIPEIIKANWTDEMLDEEINIFGQQWKRDTVLSSLIKHEAHHRAQITVLMRQAGLKVPGVYGPSKEEWAAFGMPSQE